MRLIIAPLILLQLKRKHLKEITSTMGEGWVDERDITAIDFLNHFAWKGLNSPFVISYNFNFLKGQVIQMLLELTKIYNDEVEGKINLKFSLQKVLESLYLLFEDIHSDMKRVRIYRLLEKLPINLFFRVTKLHRSLKIITENRVIRALHKYRVTTKILRLLLIPILGVPIILFHLLLSILYTTLFEGYIRFIFGLILIKTGYYTIYLYSNRNSALHNRLEFSHKTIIKKGQKIEEYHTKFKSRFVYSSYLQDALEVLKNTLIKEEIMHDKEMVSEVNRLERVVKRVTNTLKNTLESELHTSENSFNLHAISTIVKNISKVYFPKSEQPLFNMRVKEFVEFGYFVTTLSLKNIYTVPGANRLLDRIPLKLALNVNDLLDKTQKVRKYLPHVKTIQSWYWGSRLIAKRAHPIVFVASMVTPLLFQQIQESTKEYLCNITGLLLIDSYESTVLKSKSCRIEALSEEK